MITLEDYKKALGPVTDDLSEEEIIKAQETQDALAELFFAHWVEKRKQVMIKSQWTTQLLEEKTVLVTAE